MNPYKFLIVFYFLFSFSAIGQSNSGIQNSGFELEDGWENLIRSNDAYFSPVEGNYYALINGNSDSVFQETSVVIEKDKSYNLKIYLRSANNVNIGTPPVAEIELFYDNTHIKSNILNVQIPHLKGAPEIFTNDDGANIWIDGSYRMQFNTEILYQPITSNPINDEWFLYSDNDYDPMMALGQVITPQGLKALFGTEYDDGVEPYSAIYLKKATGSPPDYQWVTEEIILEHNLNQSPWIIDAHAYYDEESQKLWMSWGGHKFWVTELDPNSGKLINDPANPEFDLHPLSTHTQIAEFIEDDIWSDGYHEGAALYKHENYWYCFGSYGNLSTNYTIRYGRADNPKGPYFDKNGIDMNNNGATLLFGDEGEQLVPGHPHIWKENGVYYMGYDYRKIASQDFDYMGIRKLNWVDGWPTIYQPLSVAFNANDFPDAIGKNLSICFKNLGEANSRLALDKVSLIINDSNIIPESNILINPNPSQDIITISGLNGEYSVKVIGPKGNLFKLLIGEDVSEFNISDLPSGLYILNIYNNEGSWSKKLIKN